MLFQSVLQYFYKEILSSIVTKGTDFFLQPSRCNKNKEFLSHWAKLLALKVFATNLGAPGLHPVTTTFFFFTDFLTKSHGSITGFNDTMINGTLIVTTERRKF